jgi:hypothetical protein
MVSYPMVEQVSLASTDFEEGVSEFVKAGFTPLESIYVKPFRVAESPAAFECVVEDIIKTGDQGGAGNLVVCRILALHFQERVFLPDGRIDPLEMDLVGRMGYEYYCHANAGSIFEVPKPKTKDILGFDGLPQEIRESEFLNGKELARLANVRQLFGEEEIQKKLTENPGGPDLFFSWIEKGKRHLEQLDADQGLLALQVAYGIKKNSKL